MKAGGNQFLRFTKNINKRLLDTQLITPIALVRDKSSVSMFSRNEIGRASCRERV